MKISEFSNLNEGIGDWFAKKGFLGSKLQNAAIAKDYDERQQEFTNQVKKRFIQQFINSYKMGLSSGKIAPTVVPESFDSYSKFSKILESRVQLNEALSPHEFIVQYVKTYTSSHGDITDSPGFDNDIQAISDDIEKNGPNEQNVGKLYDYITASVSTTPKNSTSQITIPYPPADDDLTIKGTIFNFTAANKKWISGGRQIVDPGTINSLNNAYWKQAQQPTTPPSPPPPPAPVPTP